MIKTEAQKLIDNGIYIIPLFKNEKHNLDKTILTKDYFVDDVDPEGNLGINLAKSGLIDIDLDSDLAVHFGSEWLPRNTKILGRRSPEGRDELTHFFYDNKAGDIKENVSIKNLAGDTVVELRTNGNTVVYGRTRNKKTNALMDRYWHNETTALTDIHIKKIFNKIGFACVIAPHIKSANTGALKLDSCLMRYTAWSDSERESFLLDLYTKLLPNDRDVSPAKFRRIIKSNNTKRKNAGFNAYADYINVDRKKVKEWFGLIGEVPSDEKYEVVKSYHNFMERSFNMAESVKKDFPEMRYAVRPILPEGLVIICGRPKAMKSWTALELLYAVQNGSSFLNHSTVQGDCLGLFLEDSERRLVSRTKILKRDKSPQHPKICDEAPYLKMGLEESIQEWIDQATNPRLVVIDTLARVKARVKKSNATAYDLDNELLRDLQKLAITSGITIVMISHLNKAQQDYSFDKIQGSTGMQGMTDAMWLIDRGDNSNTASIVGRGRDIMDFEYSVKWNDRTFRYEYEGQLQDINRAKNKEEIILAITSINKEGKAEVKPRDVINYYAMNHNSKDAKRITRTMLRMRDSGDLQHGSKYGEYILPARKEGKIF